MSRCPGHGAIPAHPRDLVARTRAYITGLAGRHAGRGGEGRPDEARDGDRFRRPTRTVRSRSNSRRRRNAVRVYVEEEKRYMGLGGFGAMRRDRRWCRCWRMLAPGWRLLRSTISRRTGRLPRPASRLRCPRWSRPIELAALAGGGPGDRCSTSGPMSSPISRGICRARSISTRETLRASEGGIPTRLLSAGAYSELFSRLGVDFDRPVVIYSAGEIAQHRRDVPGVAAGRVRPPARLHARRRLLQVAARAAAGGAALPADPA